MRSHLPTCSKLHYPVKEIAQILKKSGNKNYIFFDDSGLLNFCFRRSDTQKFHIHYIQLRLTVYRHYLQSARFLPTLYGVKRQRDVTLK